MTESAASPGSPAPGWYPDPTGRLRWWDGNHWGNAHLSVPPQPPESAGLAFNPPPGWPKPPPGWQPPPGWRPDPSWPAPPGWNFWLPTPPAGGDRSRSAPRGETEPGEELKTALRILFPVRSWVHNSGWRQGLRLLVIVYALLPLIFLALFSNSGSLTTPGWAYSLYVAPLWAIGFWLLIRPGQIGKLQVRIGIGVIIWTLVWMNVVTVNINDALDTASGISLPAAVVVGLNEEITKALPVLLAGLYLIKHRSVTLSVRTWMFIGTIAGLTFGVAEQAFYTSNDIVAINDAVSANQAVDAVLSFAERVFVDGFQHAVWAGIAGFFIGMALENQHRRKELIVLGIAVPALLHALSDWAAGGLDSVWGVIIIQAASLLLFLGYTMSAESIEQQVRENPVFRGGSEPADQTL